MTGEDPDITTIIALVAAASGARSRDILSARRTADLVQVRHLAMWVVRRATSASLTAIGEAFDRDHSTVLHAIGRIEEQIAADGAFAARVMQLLAAVGAARV